MDPGGYNPSKVFISSHSNSQFSLIAMKYMSCMETVESHSDVSSSLIPKILSELGLYIFIKIFFPILDQKLNSPLTLRHSHQNQKSALAGWLS